MEPQPHTGTVIIGGGFAGMAIARSLERRLPAAGGVTLLSRENYITYNPLLAEVVGASILPGHVVAPIRQMIRRTRFRMVDVTGIDLERREVITDTPAVQRIPYGQLVIACGVQARLDMVPGMVEHALPLKMLGDALALRNRVLMQLERAELESEPERRRRLTRFIVVGGGFSGVEVAGELHDFLASAQRYYPSIESGDCRVVLVHSRERLLNEISPSLGEYAGRKMRATGIDIRLNARVQRVQDTGVELQSGEWIEGASVICAMGSAPSTLVQRLPLPKERGRLVVEPDMSVPGHENIWAIGDGALVMNAHDQQPAPPTAQFAIQESTQVARNIVRRTRGQSTQPFRYRPRGQLASIGRNKAVAEIYGLRISGFPAWLLWRGFYLLKIPTLSRKIRIFIEWNWEMLFPADIVHLRFTRSDCTANPVQGERSGAALEQSDRAARHAGRPALNNVRHRTDLRDRDDSSCRR